MPKKRKKKCHTNLDNHLLLRLHFWQSPKFSGNFLCILVGKQTAYQEKLQVRDFVICGPLQCLIV